jgi:peptidase M28-like protein
MRRRGRLCGLLASGLLAGAVCVGVCVGPSGSAALLCGKALPFRTTGENLKENQGFGAPPERQSLSAQRGGKAARDTVARLHADSLALAAAHAVPASIGFDGERAFQDLKRLVDFGPRPPGSKALTESRQWIIHQLEQAGSKIEEDRFVGSTPVGQIPMTNLIAKIPGARPEVVIVAGHYDTMRFEGGSFVGANDGGSSAAFLLELARRLGRRKNPVTYWLVFFDGEEALVHWSDTDSLYGSRHLAEKLTASGELSHLHAMILVDMIADAKLDIYRDGASTAWLTDLIFKTAHRLGYGKQFLDEPRAYQDDHIPFVNAGVAAADIIDLDYGPRTGAHPNGSYWHTPEDTVDKCSPASLTIVGRVVTATLEEIEKPAASKH